MTYVKPYGRLLLCKQPLDNPMTSYSEFVKLKAFAPNYLAPFRMTRAALGIIAEMREYEEEIGEDRDAAIAELGDLYFWYTELADCFEDFNPDAYGRIRLSMADIADCVEKLTRGVYYSDEKKQWAERLLKYQLASLLRFIVEEATMEFDMSLNQLEESNRAKLS